MDQHRSTPSGQDASEEIQALEAAVRAHDRLVRQSRNAPVDADSVDPVTGRPAGGDAYRNVVNLADALPAIKPSRADPPDDRKPDKA